MRAWLLLALVAGCHREQPGEPLRVAAAADLAFAFKDIGAAFENQTGQKVTITFGSTGLLAKQIKEGAPFGVFAAANVSYADEVIGSGSCALSTRPGGSGWPQTVPSRWYSTQADPAR